jgi:hypothetical protein
LIAVRFGDEHHIMPLLLRQVSDDMQELSRKVLMDEQIFHAVILDLDMRRRAAVRRRNTVT